MTTGQVVFKCSMLGFSWALCVCKAQFWLQQLHSSEKHFKAQGETPEMGWNIAFTLTHTN